MKITITSWKDGIPKEVLSEEDCREVTIGEHPQRQRSGHVIRFDGHLSFIGTRIPLIFRCLDSDLTITVAKEE